MAAAEPRAWLRLWHARVSYLLESAGIPHLLLKGETYLPPLALEEPSADVDVLVRPADKQAALDALAPVGLAWKHLGAGPSELAWHSATLQGPDTPEVDLHVEYPGLEDDPDRTWSVLRRQSAVVVLAGRGLPTVDLPAQVLVTAVSAARDGSPSRAVTRLQRAADGCTPETWGEVAELARELGAGGALRAGLEAARLADRADGLDLPVVPARWRMVAEGAPREARQLRAILALPPGRRVRALVREAFPTRAFMEVADPGSAETRWALLRAHGRRYRRLLLRTPQIVRAVRRAAEQGE